MEKSGFPTFKEEKVWISNVLCKKSTERKKGLEIRVGKKYGKKKGSGTPSLSSGVWSCFLE